MNTNYPDPSTPPPGAAQAPEYPRNRYYRGVGVVIMLLRGRSGRDCVRRSLRPAYQRPPVWRDFRCRCRSHARGYQCLCRDKFTQAQPPMSSIASSSPLPMPSISIKGAGMRLSRSWINSSVKNWISPSQMISSRGLASMSASGFSISASSDSENPVSLVVAIESRNNNAADDFIEKLQR